MTINLVRVYCQRERLFYDAKKAPLESSPPALLAGGARGLALCGVFFCAVPDILHRLDVGAILPVLAAEQGEV